MADRLKFVRMNSTEGFFTGEINGKRVLVPVTDAMPLDTEGMKALAGEKTIVQENIEAGLTVDGKEKALTGSEYFSFSGYEENEKATLQTF